MSLQSNKVGEQIPTVADILTITLSKYIALSANDYGYSGAAEELIVYCIHSLFLEAKSATSRDENPN